MPEQTPQTLNHFALLSFRDTWWSVDRVERRGLLGDWLTAAAAVADVQHLYQVAGLENRADLLVWSAFAGEEPDRPARFFSGWAEALAPVRPWVTISDTLWGFTRPSQYTKTRSTQELDPFAGPRAPYLIIYPFLKTADWYLTPREERGRMMAGHIKVGKQYDDITQLLLYSFGLQDQEFVVVYETPNLVRFMELVTELRGTEARRFTLRDWPLHAAVHQAGPEALERWL